MITDNMAQIGYLQWRQRNCQFVQVVLGNNHMAVEETVKLSYPSTMAIIVLKYVRNSDIL
jgi:hypothetical protein